MNDRISSREIVLKSVLVDVTIKPNNPMQEINIIEQAIILLKQRAKELRKLVNSGQNNQSRTT